ncbi:carbon storage regulator CsrA [Lentisphaerota bacterium WC36G]|nr:carbon storage regulator CsrA [Lentisphaerae bacterium WC36]
MLILTRKLDESIIIDNNIEIKILKVQSGAVQIGVKAPKDIEIYRQEVFEQICEENSKAVTNKVSQSELEEQLHGLSALINKK